MSKTVWVAGEALMDLIPTATNPRQPMVGGGPANTAKAIARLGYSTFFIGGIASDAYGEAIEDELSRSGVNLSLVNRGDLPTALAIATIDQAGLAQYDFELENTTSFAFTSSWLPTGDADVIHVGSVATLLEPGASELLAWIGSKSAPIIFDPNVRPSIQGDKNIYRRAVERWIDLATIVKLSDDDLNWLYSEDEEAIVQSWISRGVSIVIVTRAQKGLRGYLAGSVVDVPAVTVDLVDSVGAGDTIGAIIIEGILKYGVSGLDRSTVELVLSRAAKAAAITCSRAGANPPWRAELDQAD